MTRDPQPDPYADEAAWRIRPPRPVLLRPAAEVTELRGRRVVLGLPGLGWRADLRGDDRVVQGSRTFIPVMAEHEWYRAESEQIEVFAPLVPVERVWVETLGEPSQRTQTGQMPHLVSLDHPVKRSPTAVIDADAVVGRRVVHVVAGVERRDLRAVTEPHNGADGDICVRVAAEIDWYRWAWSGRSPRTLELPVHLVWVE